MVKSWIKLLLLISMVFGGCYLGFNYLLTAASNKAVPEVIKVAADRGIEFSILELAAARISSLTSFSWYGIRGIFKIDNAAGIKKDKPFALNLDALTIGVSNIVGGKFYLQVEGMALATSSLDASEQTTTDTYVTDSLKSGAIVVERAVYPISLGAISAASLREPSVLLRQVLKETEKLSGVAKTGIIPSNLSLTARVEFTLNERFHEVKVESRRAANGTQHLVLNVEDLMRVASSFYTRLSKPEVGLIAAYPLRVPRLLQIKHRAESEALREYGNSDTRQTAKRDAYQYVLWSYLLTREYGAEFAQKITNAHEQDVPGQPAVERTMDLQNAAIGREYFQSGIAENQIRDKIASDARVTRRYK